jgi:manganese efflux pump family protein
LDTITLFVTAIALGMDTFAVSTAVAATLATMTFRHTFRLTWHFGLFQALMTAIGWYGGAGLSTFMHGINHWIAFGLLVFLGVKMIWESRHPESRAESFDPTRGWSLVALSVATSLDALAVGVSMSLIGMAIFTPALIIGVAAFVMTFVGTRIGKTAGSHLGQWAERIGGGVLIAIGVKILIEHLNHM